MKHNSSSLLKTLRCPCKIHFSIDKIYIPRILMLLESRIFLMCTHILGIYILSILESGLNRMMFIVTSTILRGVYVWRIHRGTGHRQTSLPFLEHALQWKSHTISQRLVLVELRIFSIWAPMHCNSTPILWSREVCALRSSRLVSGLKRMNKTLWPVATTMSS